MKNIIKMYGERNTGTNYVDSLLYMNLDCKRLQGETPQKVQYIKKRLGRSEWVVDLYFLLTFQNNLGWKHTCVIADDIKKQKIFTEQPIKFITIVKNPYSWLLSLNKRPYHQRDKKGMAFDDFIISKWSTVQRDNLGWGKVLESPTQLWNIKNRSYWQMEQSLGSKTLRYEDILDSPERIVQQISSDFGFPMKKGQFVNRVTSTKEKDVDNEYYREYYLKELWKVKITSKQIETINRQLDSELMSILGYDYL